MITLKINRWYYDNNNLRSFVKILVLIVKKDNNIKPTKLFLSNLIRRRRDRSRWWWWWCWWRVGVGRRRGRGLNINTTTRLELLHRLWGRFESEKLLTTIRLIMRRNITDDTRFIIIKASSRARSGRSSSHWLGIVIKKRSTTSTSAAATTSTNTIIRMIIIDRIRSRR